MTRQAVPQFSLALMAMILMLVIPFANARAHCDTMDGPVVMDAQRALAQGDVSPILKWIPAADEDEIRAAFARTTAIRADGGDAADLAETWFLETLVRIHRAGEDAPYTGLKPAGTPLPHAIEAADKTLADELTVDALVQHLQETMAVEIRRRFDVVVDLKKRADHSVGEGREFVAAYVDYVHFIEGVADKLLGGADHHEQKPAAACEHDAR